ncbi:MAG: YhjD/YihY/BrkB family envelope integrity protein [Pseudomonadales bacterium]
MLSQLTKFISSLTHSIWLTELSDIPGWKVRLVKTTRILFAILRDLKDGQLTLRAMSLVYTTLLSLVPLLAVSFSVLKAFGVHNQIEPLLLNLLTPLGSQGIEITASIIGFVEKMKVGVLGAIGVAMLFYTVVALMQKIEGAFNYAWRVTQVRPLHQRFSDYLSVVMIGPVLVFSAIGITGTLMSNDFVTWLSEFAVLGSLIEIVTRLVPYLLIIAAFAFIYIFIPNTKVRLVPALIGALIAGILWKTAGTLFASIVVSSSSYVAIYSAFAALIFFLIWLYVGWLILLVGANIAFYIQNPDYVSSPRRELNLSNHMKERLALSIMLSIARNFYQDEAALTSKRLATHLNTPSDIVERVLKALEDQSLISQTNDKITRYLPAKPLEEMSVADVLHAIRHANEDRHLNPKMLPSDSDVDMIFGQLHEALGDTFAQQSIKQLIKKEE